MNVQEVYDQFRIDMQDTEQDFLWSDTELFRYMNDAYQMFVRLMGGISDFTSDLCQVPIVTGTQIGTYDKRILRVMEAYRVSDGAEITVINQTDIPMARRTDYSVVRPVWLDTTEGPVKYMVIGSERGKCKWVQVPIADDIAALYVYRLPLVKITEDTDPEFDFSEIGEEHHSSLVWWMRSLGYLKEDAECFNKGKADEFEAKFRDYCAQAKSEWERYKHKTRVVKYGGI